MSAEVSELREALRDALDRRGVLRGLKAQLRAEVFSTLEDGDDVCPPLEGGGGGAGVNADRATPAEAARMRMRLWCRRRLWWRRRAWAIFLATTAAAVLAAALARLPRNKYT